MPRSASILLGLFASALLLGTLPGEARAQAGPAEDLDFLISVNPVALIAFGVLGAEFEQVLTEGTSGGVSVFFTSPRDRKFVPRLNVDAVFRYFSSGRTFEGFAVGALAGFTSMDDAGTSRNAMSIGFNLEHHWLLGVDERLAVIGGVGGKRLFYFSERGEATRSIPTFRLSLGWAF